jgi:hypothetical protein
MRPRDAPLFCFSIVQDHASGDILLYAVGIFLWPTAGVKSNWKSRFGAEIADRPRCETFVVGIGKTKKSTFDPGDWL